MNMKLNGKSGFALFLIGCGALILLSKTGYLLHGLIGILFPLALAAIGWVGIRNGHSFIGWILVAIGGIGLLVKLSGLIALAVAAGFIWYGLSLLRNKSCMNAGPYETGFAPHQSKEG